MPAEYRDLMPAEYRDENGNWRQGYYCSNCGESCNMLATGHHDGKCKSDPEKVKKLHDANK